MLFIWSLLIPICAFCFEAKINDEYEKKYALSQSSHDPMIEGLRVDEIELELLSSHSQDSSVISAVKLRSQTRFDSLSLHDNVALFKSKSQAVLLPSTFDLTLAVLASESSNIRRTDMILKILSCCQIVIPEDGVTGAAEMRKKKDLIFFIEQNIMIFEKEIKRNTDVAEVAMKMIKNHLFYKNLTTEGCDFIEMGRKTIATCFKLLWIFAENQNEHSYPYQIIEKDQSIFDHLMELLESPDSEERTKAAATIACLINNHTGYHDHVLGLFKQSMKKIINLEMRKHLIGEFLEFFQMFYDHRPAVPIEEEDQLEANFFDIIRTIIVPLLESENFYQFEQPWTMCFAAYCLDMKASLAFSMITDHFLVPTGNRNFARDEALIRVYLKMFRMPTLKNFVYIEARYMKLILDALCDFKIRPRMLGKVIELFFGAESVVLKTYKRSGGLNLMDLLDSIFEINYGLRMLYLKWALFDMERVPIEISKAIGLWEVFYSIYVDFRGPDGENVSILVNANEEYLSTKVVVDELKALT